jgi:hypothetical protein
MHFAHFLAVYRLSILAETLGYATSFSSPLYGTWRVGERHEALLTDQLHLATHADTLRDAGLPSLHLEAIL